MAALKTAVSVNDIASCCIRAAADQCLELKRTSRFGVAMSSGEEAKSLRIEARVGGNRPAGARPRPVRQNRQKPVAPADDDAPPMNEQIRSATVRLLAEDQTMLGIVPTEQALEQAREAGVDLVMIAADASPPVVRIMDYSKFRYEQQKKKREAQKKAAANRQELKELKMRYNIDIADYNVRLKQAIKFLGDGDKVKVTSQFKGREMEFKELGLKLFERLANDVSEIGIVESKAQLDGRSLHMVLVPNKAALQRAAAAEEKAKRAAEKVKKEKAEGGNGSAKSQENQDGSNDVGEEEIVLLG